VIGDAIGYQCSNVGRRITTPLVTVWKSLA